MLRAVILLAISIACLGRSAVGQITQPLVAIHDSELTRALETMPASGATPTGTGTTGFQWWPPDWHYFVLPEAMKEALRSDGTPFTVISDSNITAGGLLSNGTPRFPIVISLGSEAISDNEIAQFTNYVAAGGFLIVGSSAFTRDTNGVTRGDFAFANELGVHMTSSRLANWTNNNNLTKQASHRLIDHIPDGELTWRMPSSADEICWGVSPAHPFLASHDIWRVQASSATVLAMGDSNPYLVIRSYGKGYFIYHAGFQPLIGHGGFAPGMYSYVIFRKAIEWAFESANLPVGKISPWPYQYDAAFIIRHDLENFTNSIANIEASAQIEYTNGAKGDYYFCTGTLRDDASSAYNTNAIVASLRRAVTNFGATLGPHNGGLKNPVNTALVRGQYDYWHWGLDEALDANPPGYASGKSYASASLLNSFLNIESWLAGITNGLRTWVACYFNATRDDSYDIQDQLNVRIVGDQKISPFPHWTFSTRTPGKRYRFLSEPVSDWYVNGMVAQSLEPWHPPGVHNSQTMHEAVDFYYSLGGLINIYSHTMSTGLGDAGQLVLDYMTYCLNTNLHPRMWSANGVAVYQWWVQRSNAQISVSCSTNGLQSFTTLSIAGTQNSNTAVEILLPSTNFCSLQVFTNNVLAGTNVFRRFGQAVKVRVGTSVTNVVMSYYPSIENTQVFVESFDAVLAPNLPVGWSTAATGAQSSWVTQNTNRDTLPNSLFIANGTNVGLSDLVSPPIMMPVGTAQLSFKNYYDLESSPSGTAYDGGLLEIKVGTNGFKDIIVAGGSFVTGGYTGNIDTNFSNPLAGMACWSGNSGTYIQSTINLPPGSSGQTVQFRWRCGTDDSTSRSGWRIDTVSVSSTACLCCSSPNVAPVLPPQMDLSISETTFLVVSNKATDIDTPSQGINYRLISQPSGAVIDANGTISWLPAESQGPGTYLFTTVVTDTGVPPLSATNTFHVEVTEVNSAPVLPVQTNRTLNELAPLIVSNAAVDSDLPAHGLNYLLISPPAGAGVSATGLITWTPSESQGPSSNVFTTVVTDTGEPPLSSTNSFIVIVNEVNVAPVLPNQLDRIAFPLEALIVTNTASDLDIPANLLSYSLLNPPVGVSIDENGIVTWTPTPSQDPSTNIIITVVTDSNPTAFNSTHLSATNSFKVVINTRPQIVLNSVALISEGCSPTNNAVDPGETVTFSFNLEDTGLSNTTNLLVSLLSTNGVSSPSAPQNYGILTAGGPSMSQAFSFTATGNCGDVITPTLLLQDGSMQLGTIMVAFQLGQMSKVFTQNFDNVTAPALPIGWASSATGNQAPWRTTNSIVDTVPNTAFSGDAANVGVNELVSSPISLAVGLSQLSFRHSYNLESGNGTNAFDGGLLEIKIGTNNFTNFLSAGGTFAANGYTGTIDGRYGNPLAGQRVWSGNSGGFVTTVALLPAAASGQTIQLRWRCGTDNGTGGAGWRIDTISLSTRICCANSAPVLPVQADQTIAELSSLVVHNTAIDGGAALLTYELVEAPPGATIDTHGVITWTPSEAQGPSTNVITTVVSDDGNPALSATNSFSVVVSEVNGRPVLQPSKDMTISAGSTLVFTNTAIDLDIPANGLAYMLINSPSDAQIDGNGVITWSPNHVQGLAATFITTVVTDDGIPPLSSTNTLVLNVVQPPSPPLITSINLAGEVITITWKAAPGQTYTLQYKGDLSDTDWTDETPDIMATDSTAIATNSAAGVLQRFYRVVLRP